MPPGIIERLLLVLGVEGDDEVEAAAESVAKVGKAFAAVTAAAAGAAVGLSIASVAAAEGEAVLGTYAAGLGVTEDRYRSLVNVLSVFGIESQEVAQILGDINDRTQELVDGSQSWVDDFKLLGLTQRSFAGQDAIERLDTLGEAYRNTTDRVAAAAAMMRLLGGDAIKLIPFLSQSRAEVEAMTQQYDRLAGITAEQVVAAGELTANMRRLRLTLRGLWQRALARLWPALERATDRLIDMFDAMEPTIINAIDAAIDALSVALDFLTSPLGQVIVGVTALVGGFVAAGQALTVLIPLLKLFGPALLAGLGPALPAIAAMGALLLVLEDLFVFFQGGKSVTGLAIEGLKKLARIVADLFEQHAPQWMQDLLELTRNLIVLGENPQLFAVGGPSGAAVNPAMRAVSTAGGAATTATLLANPVTAPIGAFRIAQQGAAMVSNNNTFNITSADPQAAAEAVRAVLDEQAAEASAVVNATPR